METILCSCCGEPRKVDDYYTSNSYFMKSQGRVHTCKRCLWGYVLPSNKKDYDMKKVYETLRSVDRPFIIHLWVASFEESEGKGFKSDVFKLYMRNIGMKDFRDLNWNDSMFPSDNEVVSKSDIHTDEPYDDEISIGQEEIKYWGRGYELGDYEFLEEEKYKLMSSFECPDYGMEMIMKDICFINLDIEKLRLEKRDNTQKALTNLIETRSKLMNDANMKPIQSTGAEANDQVTFGTLIKKWENTRPVPKPLDDEMKEYIDTYMIGHLAKMDGLNNEMTKKYDEALSKHTVKFEDIKRHNEDLDD